MQQASRDQRPISADRCLAIREFFADTPFDGAMWPASAAAFNDLTDVCWNRPATPLQRQNDNNNQQPN
jgi:hypothetical protein